MNDTKLYENLIAKALNGRLSDAEAKQLLNWVNASPENRKTYLDIKDTWDAAAKPPADTDAKLLEFYRKQAVSKKALPYWQALSALAAVLLIGLVIGILIPENAGRLPVAATTFSVPLGSKSEVLLPDGTKIQLNSGSSISYPAAFNQNNRSVVLRGEAFFEVHTDPENPFTVSTGNFDIEVTGTRFNVSNYAEDAMASATLVEGAVSIQFYGESESTKLRAGEKITLHKQTNKTVLEQADLEMETAWKSGEFIFREINFSELVVKLERWYDVKINYSDTRFDAYKYTGRFKNQETIWQVLDALQLTTPIRYTRKDFREFNLEYNTP